MNEQIQQLITALCVGLQPPPDLLISEWADSNRMLSSEASAQKGRWITWPWQREPMDCLSPSHPAEQVVLMCGSQLLKTEVILNWFGYVVDCDPGPMLIVEPRESDAESLSKDRIAPMIRDTLALRGKIRDVKSRDSGNTTLHKMFTGGHVTLVGSISPSGLAMRPIRYLAMDEVDRYPASAGSEGDPVSLATKRTGNFWNRKILLASTPTTHGVSRIEKAFEESDQRHFHVPCPFCGGRQALVFERLKWPEGKPREAQYQCSICDEMIDERYKATMFAGGEWVAENPGSDIPGFHLSQLYSLIRSWGDVAAEFTTVHKDPERLKVFTNTVLSETWKESGEKPDWEKLFGRQEERFEKLPAKVLFLTAGVDVQKDRLEVSIYGWGRGRQSWLIEHIVLTGDPYRAEVWNELDGIIGMTFEHESGVALSILRTAVDSGYAAEEVYKYGRRHGAARVTVVKGSNTGAALIGQPTTVDVDQRGKRLRRGCQLWSVNVSMAKAELYGWLRLELPADGEDFPPGWCHFQGQDREFFEQLTAEQWQTRIVKGFRKGEWVKTRERNETLDCKIYARAAAARVGMDRWGDQQWAALEQSLSTAPKPDPPSRDPQPRGDGPGIVRVRRRGFRGFQVG